VNDEALFGELLAGLERRFGNTFGWNRADFGIERLPPRFEKAVERRFDLPGDNRIAGDVDAVGLRRTSEVGLCPLVGRTTRAIDAFVTVVSVRVSYLLKQVCTAGVQHEEGVPLTIQHADAVIFMETRLDWPDNPIRCPVLPPGLAVVVRRNLVNGVP